jgi:streptogramin lyase
MSEMGLASRASPVHTVMRNCTREGYNFGGQLGQMQGIIVTPSGDIWAVGIEKNQLVHIPNGDPSKGRVLCPKPGSSPADNPCKLVAPFHLAIDQQDRIWISNTAANWVTRFPASDPSKVETFKAGYSGSGMAIDGQGNVWVTNRLGSSDKARATPRTRAGGRKGRGELGSPPDPRDGRSTFRPRWGQCHDIAA